MPAFDAWQEELEAEGEAVVLGALDGDELVGMAILSFPPEQPGVGLALDDRRPRELPPARPRRGPSSTRRCRPPGARRDDLAHVQRVAQRRHAPHQRGVRLPAGCPTC